MRDFGEWFNGPGSSGIEDQTGTTDTKSLEERKEILEKMIVDNSNEEDSSSCLQNYVNTENLTILHRCELIKEIGVLEWQKKQIEENCIGDPFQDDEGLDFYGYRVRIEDLYLFPRIDKNDLSWAVEFKTIVLARLKEIDKRIMEINKELLNV